MFRTPRPRWHPAVMSLVLILLTACVILAAISAEAQTFTGVQGDRSRITLAFQVKPEAVQALLPAPWQLNPLGSGPSKGANFIVVLVDRVRDDDPEGKPKYNATSRIAAFVAPGKHPQTGQTANVVLGGFGSHPEYQPGFYKVFRAATVRVEHAIKSNELDTEHVTDIWEVRDATGPGGLELRLESVRKVGARTRAKGESNIISAKDPALWRIYKFDAATDVVKSAPDGVDQIRQYKFRVTAPEYAKFFDGSEQLIGISVTPWYVRQVLVK